MHPDAREAHNQAPYSAGNSDAQSPTLQSLTPDTYLQNQGSIRDIPGGSSSANSSGPAAHRDSAVPRRRIAGTADWAGHSFAAFPVAAFPVAALQTLAARAETATRNSAAAGHALAEERCAAAPSPMLLVDTVPGSRQPKPRGGAFPRWYPRSCVSRPPAVRVVQCGPRASQFAFVSLSEIASSWSRSCALLSSVCRSCTTAACPGAAGGWSQLEMSR